MHLKWFYKGFKGQSGRKDKAFHLLLNALSFLSLSLSQSVSSVSFLFLCQVLSGSV